MTTDKKYLTLEERNIIENRLKQGATLVDVAEEIHRAKSTIWYEVKVNGGRDNYSSQAAHERAEREFKTNKERMRSHLNPGISFHLMTVKVVCLEEKMEALSMQLDIVIEQLNRLMNAKGGADGT
jgi:IS30 family transposase